MQLDPRSPFVVVVAGPNGAGKTTTAPRLLRGALAVSEYVNADPIALGLSYMRPETVSVASGRLMLARVRALAEEREDFAFETTLASLTFARWLRELRAAGHRTHLVFLSLPSADLAVARVAERVKDEGHDVPEQTIRRRFTTGLNNFFGLYRSVVDSWQLYDNSSDGGPRILAVGQHGARDVFFHDQAWNNLLEQCQ
jgi:predicted ABC-type ATPase